MRIISTVPSITELLSDLGLDEEVVGITKFCVHPNHWFRNKQRIGGTKTLNVRAILDLKPDLIIANKEENVKKQIEQLKVSTEVLLTDIKTVEDNINLIRELSALTDRRMTGIRLVSEFKTALDSIERKSPTLSCAYLVWQKPYMTVGQDTYIHNVMSTFGLENIYQDCNRYPTITLEDLKEKSPEVILLSSEPFPFGLDHLKIFQSEFHNSRISLADGEAFSWYGTRLIKKSLYLQSLINSLTDVV